jgi:hypothetical protein
MILQFKKGARAPRITNTAVAGTKQILAGGKGS